MAKNALKVGLIGFGAAGRTFHAPLISSVEGLELTAIASSRRAEIHTAWPKVRIFSDPAALIASALDLVVIATPNDSHAPWAMAALQAGRHVVVDKPFALDLSEARAMAKAARTAGRMLAAFQNRRFDSDFLTVRAALESDLVGHVSHFESHIDRYRPAIRERWREQPGAGSGIWYDLGPHLVDQALQLFGLPVSVEAGIASLRRGAKTDDWAHCVLAYPDRRVVLHASMLAAGGFVRFLAHGERGSLVKALPDPQENQLLSEMRPGDPGWGDDPDPLVVFDGVNRRDIRAMPGDQRGFYRAVHTAITDGGEGPATVAQAVGVTAVMDAARRSAEDGGRVAPALTSGEREAFTSPKS